MRFLAMLVTLSIAFAVGCEPVDPIERTDEVTFADGGAPQAESAEPEDEDEDEDVAQASASLLGSGGLCLLYPRERSFPTWVFQNTRIRFIPSNGYTGPVRVSIQAAAGAREYIWIYGDTTISRYFGGWRVNVRLESAAAYPNDCVDVYVE
jgi:hypothetical protein